jgi:trk system potassium uptake protein TrkH
MTLATAQPSRAPRRRIRIPIALRLVLALALWVAVSTIALKLPGMTNKPLSWEDTFFTAVSAATITGLTVVPTSTTFTSLGHLTLLVIIQIGGLGFVVAAALFVRLSRRRLGLEDRLSLASAMHLDAPGNVLGLMTRLILLTLIIEGIGAVFLFAHWGLSGIVPPDQLVFYSIFHAVSGFTNAGFDLFSGQPQYPGGLPGDNLTLVLLGILVILGGLGLPFYVDLLRFRQRRRVTLNTRLTVGIAVLLVLAGMAGILISEYRQAGVLSGYDLVDRTIQSWFQSVAARTAGFPGLERFSNLHSETQLLLICLMFIGTAPASMGGGITTGTFAVLLFAFLSYAQGRGGVRIGKRAIGTVVILRATAVLVISALSVLVATWLILLAQEFQFDETLFEVVAAYSTTGLSMGITDELNGFGRLIIMLMMFWGRLGAITLIIAFMQRKPPQQLVEYPEAQVLVA